LHNKHIFAQNFKKIKKSTMKKLLALMAIAGFVACNNGETKEETKDTTPAVTAPVDTTAKPVDTTAAPADTTKK
jgi:uncharacterized lipoprotein YajG